MYINNGLQTFKVVSGFYETMNFPMPQFYGMGMMVCPTDWTSMTV
jgi:hypothetical protein